MNINDFRIRDKKTGKIFSPKEYYGMLTFVDGQIDGDGFDINDSYIIEQFTGLKDQNDNKWFFGDIVRLYYQDKSSNIFEQMKGHKLDYIDFVIKEWPNSLGMTMDTLKGDMSEEAFDNFQIIGVCNLFCQYISDYTEIIGHKEL